LKAFDDKDIPDALEFLAQWVRRPAAVGAILPSGKSLAHAMARQIDVDRPGLVLELGGGTGTITKACIEIGVDPRDIVVLEKASSFCSLIRERFPDVRVIRGDATNLRRLLAVRDLGPFKAVLSGLPLLSIPEARRDSILAQAFDVLAQDGVFVQFTYGPLPPVPRMLTRSLELVKDRSAWVLKNVPPASVWRYSRAPQKLAHAAEVRIPGAALPIDTVRLQRTRATAQAAAQSFE
jgi:phosphatidylethanolamine/phosphatidyl-N-methylethanolamine N-methyltransferase